MFSRISFSAKSLLLLFFFLVVLGLLVLAYINAQLSLSGEKVYHGFRYSVVLPNGWSAESADSLRTMTQIKNSASNYPVVSVEVSDAYETDLNVAYFTNQFLDKSETSLANFNLTKLDKLKFRELEATEIAYTYDLDTQGKLKVQQIDLVLQDKLFRINYAAPEAMFDANLPTFGNLVSSMQLY